MTWAEMRAQLACTGRADEMCIDAWRPAHQRARQERTALAICATCPLLERCRAWAMSKDDDVSPAMVVGGMTPEQRRRERFGSPSCGTEAGYSLHRKRGVKPCEPCRLAHNTYNAEHKRAWRARRKGEAA